MEGTSSSHQVPGPTLSWSLDQHANKLPTLAGGHHTLVDQPGQPLMQCGTTVHTYNFTRVDRHRTYDLIAHLPSCSLCLSATRLTITWSLPQLRPHKHTNRKANIEKSELLSRHHIDHNLISASVETTQTHKQNNRNWKSELLSRFQEGYSIDQDRTLGSGFQTSTRVPKYFHNSSTTVPQ